MTYAYICEKGHEFEVDRSMGERGLGEHPCKCGRTAKQDYSKKRPQIGFIDGPSTGYYDPKFFPSAGDPTRPLLRVCEGRQHWDRYTKANDVKDLS